MQFGHYLFALVFAMSPPAVQSLGLFKFHDTGEPVITGLALTDSAADCANRPGGLWQVAGPGPFAHSSMGRTIWLCSQESENRTTILVDVALVGVPHRGSQPRIVSSFGSLANESLPNGCAGLGEGWSSVDGTLRPGERHVMGDWHEAHICVKTGHRAGGSGIASIGVVRPSSAHLSACARAPAPTFLRFPSVLDEDLVDNGALLCVARLGAQSRASQDTHVQKEEVFVPTHLAVNKDDGNPHRHHVFILGPETSGTRFWTHLIAQGRGLTTKPFETFKYDKDSAIFHISLPWGGVCTETGTVSEYLDFGGSQMEYSQRPLFPTELNTAGYPLGRLMVDIRSTILNHKARGDHVQVVLVARNPLVSFAGKMAHHCDWKERGRIEQEEAFNLLLAAKDLAESTIVCYEDMVSQGRAYINGTLSRMGISLDNIPDVKDGNEKYDLPMPGECSSDMKAYIQLCPNTKDAQLFKSVC